MNPNEQMLMRLLDATLSGKPADAAWLPGTGRPPGAPPLDDARWEAVFMLAQAHKIDGLLLDAVLTLPPGALPPANVLAAWQENAMLTMMGQALLTGQLHQLLGALEGAGVRAVTLKGVALKKLYPQPDLRVMADADLLVRKDRFAQGCRVLEGEGFTQTEEEPGVRVFLGPDGLRVELHFRLFDRAARGFLSRLEEDALFPFDQAERQEVHGGEAWVFPALPHALFMLCHMAKHLIGAGFGLRQAVDFILFVKAYDEEMDWPVFWKTAGELGLSAFASAVLELGERHLSLPRGRWAAGATGDPGAAEVLLRDLLDAGVFGNETEERRRGAGVVYRAAGGKDGGRVLRALFPPVHSLKSPFLYARKHPALLPLAWLHRLGRYLFRLITGKERVRDAAAGLELADERLKLLDRLGLRDEA